MLLIVRKIVNPALAGLLKHGHWEKREMQKKDMEGKKKYKVLQGVPFKMYRLISYVMKSSS